MYTVTESARCERLDRPLALNHPQHEEEVEVERLERERH
jgi:hypothetical protein